MIVFEAKLQGTSNQYRVIDEMIRAGRFVRNSCLKYWMDNQGVGRLDLNKYCKVLSDNPGFPWVSKLNSMARQAMAERAWSAIARFFDNCKKRLIGKKGYPRFKKHQTNASVEYKTTGWKLSEDRRRITFTDDFEAGTFKMWGTRDLHFASIEQIKRVRVVRRADGYYTQFCINFSRSENHELTGRNVGLDVGLNHFLTDSDGQQIENPRFLRKDEKALKKVQRRVSRKKKGSQNRAKARNQLGRKHLKIQRRRKDFALKTARALVQSSDLIALEDLKVRNMVKNHPTAKSISDAAWSQFREWLEYFGKVFGVPVILVAPHYTSTNCSSCGSEVKKTLSTRTHKCPHCGHIQDRDWNAAVNILKKALQQLSASNPGGHLRDALSQAPPKNTVGQTEINDSGESDLCTNQETVRCKLSRRKSKPK